MTESSRCPTLPRCDRTPPSSDIGSDPTRIRGVLTVSPRCAQETSYIDKEMQRIVTSCLVLEYGQAEGRPGDWQRMGRRPGRERGLPPRPRPGRAEAYFSKA